MNNNEFIKQQQAAVQIMREMNSRATNGNANKGTQKPHHPKLTNQPPKNNAQPPLSRQNSDLPFMELLKNGDTALILGLLLLLFSENADKRLLFALVYILL